jgi:hypothetical protein
MDSPKPTSDETFDPYHKWLGIPPKDQPPSYYRLLGVDLFESDPDVIVSATDQRMAHVRSFQTGRNSALSQRILNELAAAKVCLLDANKKAAYDSMLRQAQRGPATPPPPPPRDASAAAAAAGPSSASETFDLEFSPAKVNRKKKKSSGPNTAVWIFGLMACSVPVAVLTWFFVLKPLDDNRKVAKTDSTAKSQKTVESKSSAKPDPHDTPRPKPTSERQSGAKTSSELQPVPDTEPEPEPEPDPAPPTTQPKPEPATPSPSPQSEPEADAEPHRDTRRDPPDEHAQKEALVTVRHLYKQDYLKGDNVALAKKLLQKGKETRNDPVAQFVLYREARDLALEVRDGPDVFQAIDAMASVFKINASEMKEATLETARKGAQLPTQHASIASAALGVIDTAVADESFPIAKRLANLALNQARLAKDTALIQQAVAKNKECDAAAKTFADAQNALAALEADPHDMAANSLAGRYYCFQKGNWKKGLPMLVVGNDAVFKTLAERDLKGATSAEDQIKLGDEWWQWAEKAKGVVKSQIQKRAANWYDLASTAATGMVKDKVESRIKEALTSVTPLGTIQPGNLALASNGTTVTGVSTGGEYLLDGNVTNYSDRIHGLASSPVPCEWIIHFRQTYVLRQIRFLLFDLERARFYRYKVEVSADGQTFTPLMDRSHGEQRGWQEIPLTSQPVNAIKLIGLFCSAKDKDADKAFQVVELEAYSIIPRPKPGPMSGN